MTSSFLKNIIHWWLVLLGGAGWILSGWFLVLFVISGKWVAAGLVLPAFLLGVAVTAAVLEEENS